MNMESNSFKGFRIVLDVLIGLMFIGVMWIGNSVSKISENINELDKRVVAIESSRFTQEDATVLQRQLSAMPAVAPPPWFLEQFGKLEDRVDKMDDKLDKLLAVR